MGRERKRERERERERERGIDSFLPKLYVSGSLFIPFFFLKCYFGSVLLGIIYEILIIQRIHK